jgi:hypothetical protein
MALNSRLTPGETRVRRVVVENYDAVKPPALEVQYDGTATYSAAVTMDKEEHRTVRAGKGKTLATQLAANGISLLDRFRLAWDIFCRPEQYITRTGGLDESTAAEVNAQVAAYNAEVEAFNAVKRRPATVVVEEGDVTDAQSLRDTLEGRTTE